MNRTARTNTRTNTRANKRPTRPHTGRGRPAASGGEFALPVTHTPALPPVEDFSEEQREQIGRDLMSFMFWGYFVDRKFHADPHPGNVFISPDGEANLIDWGMVGKIDLNLSISLAVVLLSMGLNDGTSLARTWIEMGRATKRADIAGFINDMGRFVPGIAGQSLERFNFGVQLTSILKFSSKRGIATSPMVRE